jgi:hypothetical protein
LGTLFGSVTVWRLGYPAEGVACLCPLDAGLNLPTELYSYGVRRLVALQAARNSFDEVVEEVESVTGTTVHKRQVEELARAAAQDFDAFYPDQIRAVLKIAARCRVKVTLILDVIHVLEYLWKAAYCFHPDASQEAEAWVTERLRALLT